MTQPFSRTLRSLDHESAWGRRVTRGTVLSFTALWCGWFFAVPVQVAVSTASARIEASEVSHPVQAPVAGAVERTRFELGATVHAGDVLVELDATEQRRTLSQLRAEERGTSLELAALQEQIRSVGRALSSERQATQVHLEEASLLEAQARSLALLGDEARQRKELLGEQGVLSKLDVLHGISEDQEQQSRVNALAIAHRRVKADRDVREGERAELLADLARQVAVLQGKQALTAATLAGSEQEIERRRIRAPVSGRIGGIAPLTIGSVVAAGDTLASVVPEGSLRIVAEFPPALALGRIRAGQPAQMALEAFPWTAYGSVPAEVSHVAREMRAGSLRVELEISGTTPGHVQLEHGLPGSVRVQVERATPASLLWRAVGRGWRAEPEAQP